MRCLCVHAHFYQPPRENPWLDYVSLDPTAHPAHDWNTRICDECYRPNQAARLIDGSGKIAYITNNYRHLSFNVGPTLHSWINQKDPTLAQSIVEADRNAAIELGRGGAVAQAYNHMIMPLANHQDKQTQTRWGIRDFEYRFNRKPAGIWLPETAVDLETLEVLAANGIEFTILAPHQCAAVKEPTGEWSPTYGGAALDISRPYVQHLPSGKKITLIFYQGSVAHDIAFGGLLSSGDRFAEALMHLVPDKGEPSLVTIATDGETYGHHHRYGEMALARAFQIINNSSSNVLTTNIAAFLEKYPATWECRIQENTSWSCAHGIERWRSDCGCHTGGEFGWHQQWRAPLRDALDVLRDSIDELYEKHVKKICDSPWQLRDDAIELYLPGTSELSAQASFEHKKTFLNRRYGSLSSAAQTQLLSLLEAQRMRSFMYTSCGWFFNDIAGIETRQILAYAIRASELVHRTAGVDLTPRFLKQLEAAKGNAHEAETGRAVVERFVFPQRESIKTVAAAAALLDKSGSYYSFDISSETKKYLSGDMRLSTGTLSIADTCSGEVWRGNSVVFSMGGLDDVCRLSEKNDPTDAEIRNYFYVSDVLSLSRYLEKTYELGPWNFANLPSDSRLHVADSIMERTEQQQFDTAEELVEMHRRLMVQLKLLRISPPPILSAAADLVFRRKISLLSASTSSVLELLNPDSPLGVLLDEARSLGVDSNLSFLAPRIADEISDAIEKNALKQEENVYNKVIYYLKRIKELEIPLQFWHLQNQVWSILETKAATPPRAVLTLANELNFAIPNPD